MSIGNIPGNRKGRNGKFCVPGLLAYKLVNGIDSSYYADDMYASLNRSNPHKPKEDERHRNGRPLSMQNAKLNLCILS